MDETSEILAELEEGRVGVAVDSPGSAIDDVFGEGAAGVGAHETTSARSDVRVSVLTIRAVQTAKVGKLGETEGAVDSFIDVSLLEDVTAPDGEAESTVVAEGAASGVGGGDVVREGILAPTGSAGTKPLILGVRRTRSVERVEGDDTGIIGDVDLEVDEFAAEG